MPDISSPFFSVVIPVYNRENLIEEALDSILRQTYTDYEVIVVDDGSTDQTVNVVQSHEVSIKIIRQENCGPGEARNAGVKKATGKYIAFLDSDDRWFPWTLATYREVIEENGEPAFLGGNLTFFERKEDLKVQEKQDAHFKTYTNYLEAAKEGIYVGGGMTVVKRNAFEEVGGFEKSQVNLEDHDFALQLGDQDGFSFIEQPAMVAVRVHPGRVSNEQDLSCDGIQKMIRKEKLGDYPGGDEHRLKRQFIIAQHARSVSLRLAKNGKMAKGLSIYAKTFTWQAENGKWKYIVAFPFVAVLEVLKSVL